MLRRHGFTLVEMSFVLAVSGALVALAVPMAAMLVKRAHSTEARSMLPAIADAELRYFRDHGTYLACPSALTIPKAPEPFVLTDCWKTLNVRAEGPVRYRYQVELRDGSFVAIAEGDLDANDVTSSFRWDGRTMTLDVKDELE